MASFRDVELADASLAGVIAGDEDAFEVVYRALATPVMTLATRILQDAGLAQEVVQDTFLDLLQNAQGLREPAALIAWVRQVAVNHCLMRLRSPWHQRRAQTLVPELEAPGAGLGESLPDIEHALAKLSPEARAVIWLHDVEGFTHKEIGSLMQRTSSYSKSQLSRGYAKLATLYQGNQYDRQPKGTGVDGSAECNGTG